MDTVPAPDPVDSIYRVEIESTRLGEDSSGAFVYIYRGNHRVHFIGCGIKAISIAQATCDRMNHNKRLQERHGRTV